MGLTFSLIHFQTFMYYDSALTTLTTMGQVDWRTEGNKAPPNEPTCGFSGNKPVCIGYSTSKIIQTETKWSAISKSQNLKIIF
jgi:hypothetical protein